MEHNRDFVDAIIDRMKIVLGVEKDAEAAEKLGGSRTLLSSKRIRASVPFSQCIKIAIEHNVSLDWLVLGRGTKNVAGGDMPSDEAAAQAPSDLYVEVEYVDAATIHKEGQQPSSWTLPRVWLEQQGLDAAYTLIVRAAGDTMAPTISDGQLVIVDCRAKDVDGIFLVDTGKSARFRRLQRRMDGSIRMLCDNQAYEADIIPPDDVHAFEPIGYCHSVIKLLR